MNTKKKISVTLISLLSIIALASCNNGTNKESISVPSSTSNSTVSSSKVIEENNYTISFNGANSKAFGLPTKAKKGDKITFTVVPSKGYVLDSVTLSSGSLTGNAVDGFEFVMPETNVTVNAKVVAEDQQFSINYTGNHFSIFGLPEKSLKDKTINFFVNPDEGYSVKSVQIEGVTLNGSVSSGFNFVMPNKNITVNIVTESVSQGLEITFEGNNAYAINLKTNAFEGERVSFRVASASGYQIEDVTVETSSGEPVELFGNLEEGYNFVMPNSAVKVKASALGAYFYASTSSERNENSFVFQSKSAGASAKYYPDFIKGFVVNGKLTSGQSVYARAGETVYTLVDLITIATDVKVQYNGKEATKVEYEYTDISGKKYTYNAYKFVMPGQNVDLKVTAGAEATFTVKPSSATYYNAKVYKLVEEEPIYTSKFQAGETAYVEFSLKPGYSEQYIFDAVRFKYNYYSGYDLTPNETSVMTSKVDDHTYKYEISKFTNYTGDLIMDVIYKETIYAGKEFVGSFKAGNWYGTSKPTYFPSDGQITFNGAGDGKIGSNTVTIVPNSLNETTKSFTAKNTIGGSTRVVYYDNNLMWTPCDAGNNWADVYISIRGISSFSEMMVEYNSDYSMNKLAFITFKKGDGTVIGNFLRCDAVNYLNVDIELINGSTSVTNDSSFKIKKNGVVLATHNG